MKVLIATPLYPPDDGGPATRAALLERMLPGEGHTVDVVSFRDVRHLPKGIAHVRYLYALLRSAVGADVIYALDPMSVGFPALLTARVLRKPLVLSVVGDYAWEQGTQRAGVHDLLDVFVQKKQGYGWKVFVWRMIQTVVARNANAIIVPSQYLKGILMSPAWAIEEQKVHVIYNAFHAENPAASKEELQRSLSVPPHTIVSVGRFVPWKGFEKLMDAVAEVRKVIPDATLQIAGSGDSSKEREYANAHGYDFVTFLGVLPHDQLLERIKAADCFALNTGYEGLSHVILETLAIGTPVVTTNVGGNPELFPGDLRKNLVSHNDTEALSAQIIAVCSDTKHAQHTSASCQTYVLAMTEERMVEETIRVLMECTAGQKFVPPVS